MTPWLTSLNAHLSGRLHQFVQRRRQAGPLSVLTYCGYGTPTRIRVDGRVLRPVQLSNTSEMDSRWRNLQNIVRRFASREAAGVRVVGEAGGTRVEARTDVEGYFSFTLNPDRSLEDGWHTVTVSLPEREVRATAPVRVVGQARFGVISDLDDTVVVTGVTKFWQMMQTVLFGNSHTRLPFPGVGALYRALVRGPTGAEHNPVFYVSSSPWNFFDLLWTFLEYRRIPLGPLFLRDWGLHTLRAKHGSHKLEAIGRLLSTYEQLPFVLIGDSGEQDPEIYREVVRAYPGRVLAVYIRDVTGDARDETLRRLREEVRAQGIDLVVAQDTLGAAVHAHALGLIDSAGVRQVLKSTEE